MKQLWFGSTLAIALLVGVGPAAAGGSEGTIGIGAESLLSGGGGTDLAVLGGSGLSVNYDGGKFHLGGMLMMADAAGDNNTDLGVAGRFFWHVHSTPLSDLSIGGNLGVVIDSEDDGGDGSSQTLLFLEPSMQIRAFIAGNVALSLTAGIAFGAADAEGVALGGQLTGGAGLHYYFF
jgi:hypothetical protein